MEDFVLTINIVNVYMDGPVWHVMIVCKNETIEIHIYSICTLGKCPGFTNLICSATTCPAPGSAPVCQCPGYAKGKDCSGS